MKRKSSKGLRGLGEISSAQERFIKRRMLGKSAMRALAVEYGRKNKMPARSRQDRKAIYPKIYAESEAKPLTPKHRAAIEKFNDTRREVARIAKQKGGGSAGWRAAWAAVSKKKRR